MATNYVLSTPSSDDLIRLLKAWRLWLLGAVAGALIGALVFLIAPPIYRARATVNVDFHMEQAWPQSTDREQFYYLERETRKLEEIANSDAVLSVAASQVGGWSLAQLHDGMLQLGQPGNGGWHFYVDDRDPKKAAELAAAWAQAFAKAVKEQVALPSSTLEQYITADPVQVQNLTAHRAVSMSIYILAGALIVLALTGVGLLFLHRVP